MPWSTRQCHALKLPSCASCCLMPSQWSNPTTLQRSTTLSSTNNHHHQGSIAPKVWNVVFSISIIKFCTNIYGYASFIYAIIESIVRVTSWCNILIIVPLATNSQDNPWAFTWHISILGGITCCTIMAHRIKGCWVWQVLCKRMLHCPQSKWIRGAFNRRWRVWKFLVKDATMSSSWSHGLWGQSDDWVVGHDVVCGWLHQWSTWLATMISFLKPWLPQHWRLHCWFQVGLGSSKGACDCHIIATFISGSIGLH